MYPSISIPSGVWPVMLTPFDQHNRLDEPALKALIEYYIVEQVAGLYAVCGSSEMLYLDNEEVVRLSRMTQDAAGGHVPVIATGNFGDTLDQQITMMRRVADTGVAAVAIATSLLPSGDDMLGQILRMTDATDFPLAIYECPVPVHRNLAVEDVGALARTGRFHAFKETSRKAETYLAKVAICHDTPLRIFQANLVTLFNTGSAYGHGFMGCLANIAPRLLVKYLAIAGESTPEREHLVEFLRMLESRMYLYKYPASAKYILNQLGVPMTTVCRWGTAEEFSAQRPALDAFIRQIHSAFIPGQIGQTIAMPTGDWPTLNQSLAHQPNVAPALD